MLLETTLLFKTMLILSAQIGIVFGLAYFCIFKARKAYETNTKFFGMSFRAAMNMKRDLDLVPFIEPPKEFPIKMKKHIEEKFNEETKSIDKAHTISKEANSREEVLELMGDGYYYGHGGDGIVQLFAIWAITLFATTFYATSGISIVTGMTLFTIQSLAMGFLLGIIMLEMDENDGIKALKLVLLITILAGFIGYSDIYSFAENMILQVILLFALLGMIVFSLIRNFMAFSRQAIRIKAIFGAFLWCLFLLVDFNILKKQSGFGNNNWDTAFEIAFTIYLDMINLLLEILDAMSNS